MNKYFFKIDIILFLLVFYSFSQSLVIESTASKSLRNKLFAKAIVELEQDTSKKDYLYFFKLANAYNGINEKDSAYNYYLKSIGDSSLLSAFSYEKIGDIENERGRYKNALTAYRTAINESKLQRYTHYMYNKMYKIVTEHINEIGNIAWLEEIVGEPPANMKLNLTDEVDRFLEKKEWFKIDSLITNVLDTSSYKSIYCQITKKIKSSLIPDTALSTVSVYKLSKISYKCKNYKFGSDWLLKAIKRNDFSKVVDNKDYIFYRAKLNNKLKNYNKSIKWFKKYDKKYGLTPELVYLMARNYRGLGKNSLATQWYDKHIKLYPKNTKTHDILWYRAWQKEEIGNNEGARKLYRRIYKEHKGRKRADDAYFRIALSYIKDDKPDLAQKSFKTFIKKYKNSSLNVSARYWEAKSYLLMHNFDIAKDKFIKLSNKYPTNYYGYRAREMLLLMGDTTNYFSIDTTKNLEKAVQWLDSTSHSIKRELSKKDSISLETGLILGSVGMVEYAEFFLETIETCYPGNLLLQMELANFYEECNAPVFSYRVIKRLSVRIPQDARLSMPLPLYRIIYPNTFSKSVVSEAMRFQVNPELVQAIIKQESMFNPQIVSPVGAIGLMQIMPYTGKQIAKDLNIKSFDTKNLYNPETNILFGAYYISKLLKRFKGNFVLAIASYNGGPHNVEKWYKRNSDEDFDMFIEDIGFTETREYVKKVIANYWTYMYLNRI